MADTTTVNRVEGQGVARQDLVGVTGAGEQTANMLEQQGFRKEADKKLNNTRDFNAEKQSSSHIETGLDGSAAAVHEINNDAPLATDTPEPAEPKKYVSRREEALARADKHYKDRRTAEETASEGREGSIARASGMPVEQQQTAQPFNLEGVPMRTGADGLPYVVMKVDGVEVLKPFKQVFSEAQKYEAADQRLAKASTALSSVQRMAADLQARQDEFVSTVSDFERQLGQNVAAAAPKDKANLKKSGQAFLDALYAEDTDAVVKHLDELTGRGNSTQAPDSEAVRQAAQSLISQKTSIANAKAESARVSANTVEAQQQIYNESHATALSRFQSEFPDIRPGTPEWDMADALTLKLGSDPAYQGVDPTNAFLEAGKRVRQLRNSNTINDRNTRKLENSTVGSRSSVVAQTTETPAPSRPSQTQLIADMRRTRRPNSF